MRIATYVTWFSEDQIKLDVHYGQRGTIAMDIYDMNEGFKPENNRVFVNIQHQKKLEAAVKAFNKAWEDN
jgi:hypothetical protein